MADINGVWCADSRGHGDRFWTITWDIPNLDDLDFSVLQLFLLLRAVPFSNTGDGWMWGKSGDGNGKGGVHGSGDLCDHSGMSNSLHGVLLKSCTRHGNFYRYGGNLLEEYGS